MASARIPHREAGAQAPAASLTIEVATADGRLRGAVARHPDDGIDICAFKGIPYAAPPLGPLRWRPPQPVPRWEGVRQAFAFGPDCWQEDRQTSRAADLSEDCLFLNVWAPHGATAGSLPVMVWLHGGSYLSGSGSDVVCDGAALAAEGVVVVTVNYRLGLFGFLAHPALSRESEAGASGNYGLLDQLSALQWVRENIAAFGGNPARVTLFGVSAGAASISLLLSAGRSAGHFQQAILQSPGAARPLASLADAQQAGLRLGEDLQCLRALPAPRLLAMTSLFVPARRSLTEPRVLRPIRDGWLLAEDERNAWQAGHLDAMPLIVGGNLDEGSMLTGGWPIKTRAQFNDLLQADFSSAAVRFSSLYPVEADAEVRARVAEIFADTQFNAGIRLLTRTMAARERRTWRYLFTQRRADRQDGPHHTAEVPYVFGNLRDCAAAAAPDFDESDRAISRRMMKAWTAFARSGDPNAVSDRRWPACSPDGDPYLEIGKIMEPGSGWRRRQLDAIDEYFAVGPASDSIPHLQEKP